MSAQEEEPLRRLDFGRYQKHRGFSAPRTLAGGRVLSTYRVMLLVAGSGLLGANVVLVLWGWNDGRTLLSMLSPLAGCVVALGIMAQAWVGAPLPEEYEPGKR